MKTYFKQVETLEELRRQYKELLKQHHPDNGGEVAAMQDINAEYERLFQRLKERQEARKQEEQRRADGRATGNTEKTAAGNREAEEGEASPKQEWYDWERDLALRKVLQDIIGFNGIVIDIVGYFIWLYGETYPYKKELKKIGFRWSKQRRKWYWHNGTYRKRGSRTLSYEEIQDLYGSTEVKAEQKRKMLEA